jgi:HEAT repeat protein
LVSASEDSTALAWDLKGVLDRMPVPRVPDGASIDEAWKDLASPDAALAYRALGRLVDGGDASVSLLGKRLQAARPADGERVQKLLADLDSETFVVRERATSELKKMTDLEESVLERYLAQTKSLEAKRRATQLLQRAREPIADPQHLQSLRAIEALECIGTPAARRVLESLSVGTSKALLTIEAKRSAERLAKRLVSH